MYSFSPRPFDRLQQGFTIGGMGSDRHFAWQQASGPNALGQKRTLTSAWAMSALPPKADIVQHVGNVRFVPIADIRDICERSDPIAIRIFSSCGIGEIA